MNVLTLLTASITVLAALGGSVAFFGKKRGDSIIEYQARNTLLDKDSIARLEKDNAALVKEVSVLRDQNQRLSELAQGSPQLTKLTEQISRLVDQVTKIAKNGS